MRRLARFWYLSVFGSFSNPTKGIHLLNGHFAPEGIDRPELLREKLKMLNATFDFIDFDSATEMIMKNRVALAEKPRLAFSFDDGFQECYDVLAPVFEEFGVNACFFVNPGFIDGDSSYRSEFCNQKVKVALRKPMDWQMLRDLKSRGFVVGNHTHDHNQLSALNRNDIEFQIKASKERIEYELGAECEYFAWPYGQYADVSNEVLEIAAKYHRVLYGSVDDAKYGDITRGILHRRHVELDWPISHVRYFTRRPRRF